MRGKHKTTGWPRVLAWNAEEVARQCAVGIMESVDGQEAYCEDASCKGRIRWLKAVECAAIAAEVGQGRRPDLTPEPACSGRVAAEARMAAGR